MATLNKTASKPSRSNKIIIVTCSKCKCFADSRQTAVCSDCKQIFHFDCAGYSEKLYTMLEPQKKDAWRCKTCIQKTKSCMSSSSSNVTLRRGNKDKITTQKPAPVTKMALPTNPNTACVPTIPSEDSMELPVHSTPSKERSDSQVESNVLLVSGRECSVIDSAVFTKSVISGQECSELDATIYSDSRLNAEYESSQNSTMLTLLQKNFSRSMDCTGGAFDAITIIEMREEIDRLTSELASTQNQLEEESIENNGLKRTIKKLQREIEILKILCQSSNISSKAGLVKLKRQSLHSYSLDKYSLPPLNSSFIPLSIDGTTGCPNTKCGMELERFKQLVQTLETEIAVYKHQISQFNTQIEVLSRKLLKSSNEGRIDVHNLRERQQVHDVNNMPAFPKQPETSLLQSKLCVISNYSHYMIELIKQEFPSGNTCVYLTPGAGTRQLFGGLQDKLRDFTLNDFCIICIGDKDFKTSTNYFNLVKLIQEQLSLVQHTNIIICLPTFKLNQYSSLFTKRVEIFNSLMYKNNLKQETSYILDSNLNLSYNNSMFTQTGNLNRQGFITVFNDLIQLMTFSINCNMTVVAENSPKPIDKPADNLLVSNFFRS